MISLEIFKIKNSQKFFKEIDSCKSPIYVKVSKNKKIDLRFNLKLRNFITWKNEYDSIESIKLQCTNIIDANRIFYLKSIKKF